MRSVVSQEPGAILGIDAVEGIPRRIAFGSCSNQNKPQPILQSVVASKPDLFVYLGDNIYGDTVDMGVLRGKYEKLGAKPEFQRLRATTPTLSIWDDHDYGANDAGKEYPKKVASRDVFFDFWRVPPGSDRRKTPGIYGVHEFREKGRVVQVILLDTRSFRDPLDEIPESVAPDSPWKNDYRPTEDRDRTLLGSAQWAWLESVFRRPADFRLVCSSIQFGHEYNGWESWTNLPHEQNRMIELIRATRANGVVFISGDVHWGEISRREVEGGYPIYDVTSSGLTETWPTVEPNRYRVGPVVRTINFGLIELSLFGDEPHLTLRVMNRNGEPQVEERVPLEALTFASERP